MAGFETKIETQGKDETNSLENKSKNVSDKNITNEDKDNLLDEQKFNNDNNKAEINMLLNGSKSPEVERNDLVEPDENTIGPTKLLENHSVCNTNIKVESNGVSSQENFLKTDIKSEKLSSNLENKTEPKNDEMVETSTQKRKENTNPQQQQFSEEDKIFHCSEITNVRLKQNFADNFVSNRFKLDDGEFFGEDENCSITTLENFYNLEYELFDIFQHLEMDDENYAQFLTKLASYRMSLETIFHYPFQLLLAKGAALVATEYEAFAAALWITAELESFLPRSRTSNNHSYYEPLVAYYDLVDKIMAHADKDLKMEDADREYCKEHDTFWIEFYKEGKLLENKWFTLRPSLAGNITNYSRSRQNQNKSKKSKEKTIKKENNVSSKESKKPSKKSENKTLADKTNETNASIEENNTNETPDEKDVKKEEEQRSTRSKVSPTFQNAKKDKNEEKIKKIPLKRKVQANTDQENKKKFVSPFLKKE